jgi:hypothetical protein
VAILVSPTYVTLEGEQLNILVQKNATINVICSLIKKKKKFEYSITGNDVVPQNMIGDIFLGHPVYINLITFELLRKVVAKG